MPVTNVLMDSVCIVFLVYHWWIPLEFILAPASIRVTENSSYLPGLAYIANLSSFRIIREIAMKQRKYTRKQVINVKNFSNCLKNMTSRARAEEFQLLPGRFTAPTFR